MYEIIKQINDTVFLGYRDKKVYILKKIHPDETELYKKIMALHCGYVIKIFELTVIDGSFYAVCEYVSGDTLEQLFASRGAFSDEETKRIALAVCDGLEALHSVGIIHRDITPKNVMLTGDGEVRIIDFGISRIKKENAVSDTELLGTNGFAAPEQYGFGQSTEKADIYAVGVLINYMKTGLLPSEKTVKGTFGAIVAKCTRMDADERYPDILRLRSALNEDSRLKRMIRFIPGFGKGILYREILSVTYYLLLIFLGVAFVSADSTGGEHPQLLSVLFYFSVFIIPVPIIGNMGLWSEKWKYTRSRPPKEQLLIRFLLTVCTVTVCCICIFCLL